MIGDDTYVYRRQLPHLLREHKTYFVTFVTANREILPEVARDIVLQQCIPQDGYHLHCACVMPDHVHLIVTPDLDTALPKIMQRIKSVSAHMINRVLGRQGRVWQYESWDHIIRSDESLDAKVQYVLDNPVRKGSCAMPPNGLGGIRRRPLRTAADAAVWRASRPPPHFSGPPHFLRPPHS